MTSVLVDVLLTLQSSVSTERLVFVKAHIWVDASQKDFESFWKLWHVNSNVPKTSPLPVWQAISAENGVVGTVKKGKWSYKLYYFLID